MSVTDAVDAILKLNPHPHAYARATFSRSKKKWSFPIVKAPLTREIAELHVRGKRLLGAVGSDPNGFTTTVGLDLDAHTFKQDPVSAAKRFVLKAKALDIPILMHKSKSGAGLHIRTVFRELVPVHEARALYVSLVLLAGLAGDAAVDKVWPPPYGLGVLAFPYNAKFALETGGCLALDPFTMRVLDRSEQMMPVLDSTEPDRDDLIGALKALGLKTHDQVHLLSSGAPARQDPTVSHTKKGTDKGIHIMFDQCEAVNRLRYQSRELSYEFWFGMMTNFAPFADGHEFFTTISKLDSARFDEKRLNAMWSSIKGGPRYCENLDMGWTCPKRATCTARSPAGLVPREQR
jgi:hypothetical protein